ncbi:MAG: hypothetical protein HYS13_22860 [Planctomycetia bacterium]|nr:hypothetical protein [Planctomycetia bacterium]
MFRAKRVVGKVSSRGLLCVVVLAAAALPSLSQEKARRAEAPTAGDLARNVARLEARIEKIEATLQRLVDRLEASSAAEPPKASSSAAASKALRAAELGGRRGTLYRVDGRLEVEAADTKEGKALWKTLVPAAQLNAARDDDLVLRWSADGQWVFVTAEIERGDVAVKLEGATGRVAQISIVDDTLPLTPAAPTPAAPAASAPPSAAGAAAAQAPRDADRGSATSVAGGQIDLVTMSTAYIDAAGHVRLAIYRLARMQAEPDLYSQLEVESAVIDLATAERKIQTLGVVVAAAHEAASAELVAAQRLGSDSQVAAAKAKLKIIESIIKQASGAAGTSSVPGFGPSGGSK